MTTAGSAQQAQIPPGRLCFGFFAFFCLVLFFRNATVAISYLSAGLTLCAKTLIPSLFPFLVLSELIVSSGSATVLLKPISGACKHLLRLPADGYCAILLGLLCGFPVGARAAVHAYDRGTLTQEETERVLCCSTSPSVAFLINAVGISTHQSRLYGVLLLCATLISSLLTGLLLAHLPGTSKNTHDTLRITPPTSQKPTATLFTEAVRAALLGMLTVCAYVVFFSAFCGTLTTLFERLSLSAENRALLFCLFELSGGVSAAGACASPVASALLTAFAVGWSGISVHCQILSVCGDRPLRMRRYLLCKALQGLLTAAGFWLLLHRCPEALCATGSAVMTVAPAAGLPAGTLLFLLGLPLLLRKRKHTKQNIA